MLFRRYAFFLAVLASHLPVAAWASSLTCTGTCGGISSSHACWCDNACTTFGDCCPDAFQLCGPTISTQSPSPMSTVGGSVTITVSAGIDTLGSQTSASAVSIGGVACAITQWGASSVTCTAPAGVGTPALSISYADPKGATETATGTFSYAAPIINSISPSTDIPVIGGTSITLVGTNFGPQGSTAAVYMDGTSCTVTAHNQTQLVFNAPAGSGANDSVWTVIGSQPSNKVFLSYAAPIINSISGSGTTAGGNTLTITGSNFGSASAVMVGGNPCTVFGTTTSSSLTCTVPAGAGGTVGVVVTDGTQSSNTVWYTYAAPSISGIVPTHGTTAGGTALTISGTSFGLAPTVTVGGQTCALQSSTHTSITCTTPAGMGIGQSVQVTVMNQSSNTVTFNYDPPFISTLSPNIGLTAGNTPLTITGTNFGASGASVTVGSAPCPVTQQSQTSITCTLPAGTAGASATVTVTVSGQSANAPFSYAQGQITSIIPASGPTQGGTQMTISGTNFGTSGATVTIGGVTCPLINQSNTQISCTIPAGSGGGLQVVVTINGKPSNALTFSYDAPFISSITPDPATPAGGIPLTIAGANFGPGNATVTVGTAPCPVTSAGQTQVVCTLPAGNGSGLPVTVTTGGQSGPGASFSYFAPLVSGVTPLSAPPLGGTALTLTGQYFGPSPTVLVGRNNCPVTSSSETQAVCTLPAGTGAGLSITLAQGNQTATASSTFSYVPQIASISPATGSTAGGTTVTISGTSFSPTGTVVSLGTYPCTNIQATETSITCTTSPGVGKNLTVGVSVNGVPATGALTFSYAPPAITTVSPADGSSQGGTTITIGGNGFGPAAPTVMIGGNNCPVTRSSDSSVTCTLPAGTGTNLDIVLTAGGQTSTKAGAFSYDPVITSITPVTGPAIGNVTLQINGTSLGSSGGSVIIGSNDCPITTQSETSITCTLPAGVGTDLPVLVTMGTLLASGPSFSYDPPLITSIAPLFAPASGGTMTITGVNFGPVGAVVTIGGATCVVTQQTDGSITCEVPPGSGTGLDVSVTAGQQTATAAAAFSYDAAVTSITPVDGPTAGGVLLTINGVDFGGSGALVTVGGVTCPVVKQSDTTITCTLSMGEGTSLTVLVIVNGQMVDAGKFSYDPPAIQSIAPTHGPAVGGTLLTVTGLNFGLAPEVLVGSSTCPVVSSSQTQITCTVPAGIGLNRAVIVRVGTQNSQAVMFNTDPPAISSVNPATGPTAGGTPLTLTGANFGATGATVTVGTASCPVTAQSDSTIVCTLPAGTGLNQPVVVTVGGQSSAAASFSYQVQAPSATSSSATLAENSTATVTLAANDPQGLPLTYEVVAQPPVGQGTVTLSGAQATYTPPTGYFGTTGFSFRASNGQLDSNTAQVTLTVTQLYSPPVATPVAVTTQENVPLVLLLQGTSTLGSPLTYALSQQPDPSAGQVVLNGAQATFTPATGYIGDASFSFTVSDGQSTSDPATVQISVVANSNPPVAQDIAVTTPEDVAVGITLSGSDATGDALTFTVQQPAMAEGSVTLAGSVATFTPTSGFSGTATFTYVAADGTLMSAPATVTITVTPVNKPPVADGQVLQTTAGQPLEITLTGTDPQDEPLTFAIVTPPPASAGTVTLSGATATFTPASEFIGTTSFVFSASDGTLSANATITVTVAPASPLTFVAPTPDAPITVNAGQLVTFQVAAQSAGAITYSIAGLPSAAMFDGSSGKFSWQTKPTDSGTYGMVVEASDGVHSATRTITIAVTGSTSASCGTTGSSSLLLLAVIVAVELMRRRTRSSRPRKDCA